MLAGGTDLISLMKDYLHTPKRVVNIKNIKELGRHPAVRGRPAHRRHGHLRRTGEERRRPKQLPVARRQPRAASPARRSATWEPSAATCASVRAAGITARASACSP